MFLLDSDSGLHVSDVTEALAAAGDVDSDDAVSAPFARPSRTCCEEREGDLGPGARGVATRASETRVRAESSERAERLTASMRTANARERDDPADRHGTSNTRDASALVLPLRTLRLLHCKRRLRSRML